MPMNYPNLGNISLFEPSFARGVREKYIVLDRYTGKIVAIKRLSSVSSDEMIYKFKTDNIYLMLNHLTLFVLTILLLKMVFII